MHKRGSRTRPLCTPGTLGTVGPLVFHAHEVFLDTQIQLHWQLCDLCRFHEVLYAEVNCQASEQDERGKRLRELRHSTVADEEDPETFDMMESRASESIFQKDAEIVRLKHHADEFTVIGLWAMAEDLCS